MIAHTDKMVLSPSNGKTALITGINGYIASVIGHELLQKGYNLRGTSRSAKSSDPLFNGAYQEYASRVEIVEVPDMTVTGAFDEAVKGVNIIFHTASPINFTLTSWDDFVTPAIHGTVGILKSALDHAGPELEIVVVTSSVAAVTDPAKNPHTFTEADWNNWAEAKAKELGDKAPASLLYPASKAAAEKALWKFRDEHKPPFAISAINPGVVTGPPVQPPAEASQLNETLKVTWELFSGELQTIPPPIGSGAYVDVRDVARIQVWAAEHPAESANQRYIATAGRGPPQAVADVLRKAYPARAEKITKGEPGQGYPPDWSFPEDGMVVDGTKAEKAVGFTYIKFDKSILDTAKVMERYL